MHVRPSETSARSTEHTSRYSSFGHEIDDHSEFIDLKEEPYPEYFSDVKLLLSST